VSGSWRSWAFTVLALLVACGPGGDASPPTGGVGPGLSIAGVVQGQALTGSLAVAALGVGGPAIGVSFELGGTVAAPDERGIAILNTRAVDDGPAELQVSATVAGRQVVERLDVVIANGLPSAATLGPAGGALRSGTGSVVVVPPGALGGPVPVSVRDSSQQEILDEFGIDYPALGVTFLGAVSVETGTERFRVPMGLDMAGWAQAMQPGQQAVMFAVLPDASGNGVGELTFAANAVPTPDGSVVSLPTVRSEVYGRASGGGVVTLQSFTARPGEIVALQGRGFNPAGISSNVARFASGPDLLVVPSVLDDAAFGPLMEVRWAVPALGSGTHGVTLHNLTTGYATEPFDLGVGALASGSAASFGALVGQVRLAVEALTVGRPDLAAAAVAWLEALEASSSAIAWGMAAGSGLVSASHRTCAGGDDGGGRDDRAARVGARPRAAARCRRALGAVDRRGGGRLGDAVGGAAAPGLGDGFRGGRTPERRRIVCGIQPYRMGFLSRPDADRHGFGGRVSL
jgi:hypothetical protein